MNDNLTSRRRFIQNAGIGLGAAVLAPVIAGANPKQTSPKNKTGKVVKNGNIKQVIAGWCFMNAGAKWSVEKLAQTAKDLGCAGVELVPPDKWGPIKKHKLVVAATPSHKFIRGMNNPLHWPECTEKLNTAINAASAAGFPNVMTFTGFGDTTPEGLKKAGIKVTGREKGSVVDAEQGMKNCIEAYKKIVGTAERKKVTMVLEPLNTRDPEKMKGHPGYQGDHVDYCMEIIKKVGSPSLRLLFDVYHIQIMDGDLVRRIHQLKEYIGHVQIAGNPGRGEISDTQEINYRAVMKAFVDIGYQGYVGHEWIPTGDPLLGLREAVAICDV